MDRHVESVERIAAALRVVDVKRLVAEHGAPGGGFCPANFMLQKCKRLPRELAADAEAADVAAQDKIPGGSELVTYARADQWIEPANAFCGR